MKEVDGVGLDIHAGIKVKPRLLGELRGNGSLQVKFFLYKQVCKNGLVMEKMTGKVLHKRHLGRGHPAAQSKADKRTTG